ncbi:OmpA family protein [Luteolibacter yonseiensis]|uniref:OmpA family protein n=1 Tax=Luteolibacter yonseiensis TaxID=1144680 RepID=A0A934R385_9BACT|nr:OmpA family protein [Luteolibacter yonseiensis]MBK1814680.1 OmpA family protein [Luteolibacter yonseiensis]
MLVSILLHVIVFLWLDDMKVALKFEEARELSTRPIDTRRVEIPPLEQEQALPPEDIVTPPTDTAALLEDVELLDILPKDQEIDIKPQIVEPEYAIRLQNPAREGTPDAVALEISTGLEIDTDLPEFGRQPETIKPAEIGQITVDAGAVQSDDTETSQFLENLTRQGANGKVEAGSLDGMTSLDNMLNLPSNVLLGAKTMLPSDLLFEFNRAELRESSKVDLMKLVFLMDRNPDLYCWIEGHTDLVGGDEPNLKLSIARAESVKNYLVQSYRINPDKIITRGFGRYQPIITSGTPDEQSANRRVEIRMRKTPPTKEQMKVEPQKATVIEEAPSPKAVLVKPKIPMPVQEAPPSPPKAAPVETPAPKAAPVEMPAPPKAAPIQEAPAVPKAAPVEMPAPLKAAPVELAPPLRAEPVVEEVPRAQTIEDEE